MYILSEDDIFKHFIYNVEKYEDAETREEEEIYVEDIKRNMKWFLKRVPVNIFHDEYYVLYKAIEAVTRFDGILDGDILLQFLESNINEIIHQDSITLFEDNDKLTLQERKEQLKEIVATSYESLLDMSLTINDLVENAIITTDSYLKAWCTSKYEEIIYNQLQILGEGRTVGRTFYQGIGGAKQYYNKAIEMVDKLYEDDGLSLSQTIDTSTMTYDEVKELYEEQESTEVLFKTGLNEFDENIEFRKGELVTIQAGSGVGKTRTAVGVVAYPAIRAKKNVLYLSLEQKSTRILPMFNARHITEQHGSLPSVSSHTILNGTYPMQYRPQVMESERDFVENNEYGNLRIESSGINATSIGSVLESVWDSGFHFDVVVLDYFGLLETNGNRYEDLTTAINYMNDSCKNFRGNGYLGIIVHQLTKEAEQDLADGNPELVVKTGGSETQYITRSSDYILTLHQDSLMRRTGRMKIYAGKTRTKTRENAKDEFEFSVSLGSCAYFELQSEE